MKKIMLILCVAACGVSQAQTKKTSVKKIVAKPAVTTTVFKSAEDTLSYALGLEGASYYKSQGFEHINAEMVKKAFDDVFGGKKILLTAEQSNSAIMKKMQDYKTAKASGEKEAGKKFLAENKKRPGVIELPSGLQYEIIKAGTGPKPLATDTVSAHYIGSLINGKEFDNSYTRKRPLEIPVSGVIPGWTEALKLMPVGSTWKLYIPSELGYGDYGAGNGGIPGGAALVFTVELLAIVHK